jgi:chromatin remodeling complex protein RSC6
MMIFGSGTIVSLLTRHRLIDEYQFVVSPVLLGGGRNLLSGVPVNHKLELKEEKRFPSGRMLVRYELVQPATTAALALEKATDVATEVAARKARSRPAKTAAAQSLRPDAALSKVVGSEAMSRSQMTKKLWSYIKRKGLQDKKNRRMINADDALRPVFGGKSQVNMLEIPELVEKHLKAQK